MPFPHKSIYIYIYISMKGVPLQISKKCPAPAISRDGGLPWNGEVICQNMSIMSLENVSCYVRDDPLPQTTPPPPKCFIPIFRSDKPGVKLIGMHRFNICLVVVLLWCENTISNTLHLQRNTAITLAQLVGVAGNPNGVTSS